MLLVLTIATDNVYVTVTFTYVLPTIQKVSLKDYLDKLMRHLNTSILNTKNLGTCFGLHFNFLLLAVIFSLPRSYNILMCFY